MMDCTQKGRHWTMASYTIKHSVCYQNTTIVEIIHIQITYQQILSFQLQSSLQSPNGQSMNHLSFCDLLTTAVIMNVTLKIMVPQFCDYSQKCATLSEQLVAASKTDLSNEVLTANNRIMETTELIGVTSTCTELATRMPTTTHREIIRNHGCCNEQKINK